MHSKYQRCKSGRWLEYSRTRAYACHLLIHDPAHIIPILRSFAMSIWHTIFFFTNFCIRSFGIRSFVPSDLLLTIICLRLSCIRSFLYEHLLTIFWHTMFCPIRLFSYEHLAYDLFLYELLLTIFCRTMFCPIWSFAYEHLLTNFWHTNIRHTNVCPLTVSRV